MRGVALRRGSDAPDASGAEPSGEGRTLRGRLRAGGDAAIAAGRGLRPVLPAAVTGVGGPAGGRRGGRRGQLGGAVSGAMTGGRGARLAAGAE